MIRRTALLLSVTFLFSVSAFFSTGSVTAQTQIYAADTGIINLQPGQVLRLSVAGVGGETPTIYFRTREYADVGTTGGVTRKQLVGQTVTGSYTIAPDQGASIDIQYTIKGVRGEVISTSKNLKLTAIVMSPASSGSNGSSIMPMEQISFNFTNITLE